MRTLKVVCWPQNEVCIPIQLSLTTTHATDSLICYHCGQSCASQLIPFDAKTFCCDGCLTVYQLLQENNLCNFYAFQEKSNIQPQQRDYRNRFAYLDDSTTTKQLLKFESNERNIVQFELPQMHCSSCVWLLEHLYRISPGIIQSRVDFMEKSITIDYKPSEIGLRVLVELLTTLGYEPLIRLNNTDKKVQTNQRTRIYRIAVSGFCFGNIMMLSFPEYFHITEQGDESLQQVFAWMNLGLSIPALLFGGSEFFISAWNGIKNKFLNIDIPLVLSLLLTFGRSVFEITTGTGPGYLDSMTGIIFFMLIGRHFQMLTYHRIQFDRDYKSFFPISVSVISDTEVETTIPLTKLQLENVMHLRDHEIVPADGVLLSKEAMFDYSFVTGESDPIHLRQGDVVYAGGRIIGKSIQCRVAKEVSQSYLTGLWNKQQYKTDKTQTTNWIDRLANHFTIALLLISLAAFAYWLPTDVSRAFNALTTVLIVACPCALLLSATFTQGTMLRIFSKNGLYFKNAQAIESLSKTTYFLLDKTGTLTSGEVTINYHGVPLTQEELQMLASTAAQSNHPLSRSLRSQLPNPSHFDCEQFEEFTGIGVQASINKHLIRLGKAHFCSSPSVQELHTVMHVNIDNAYRGYFAFEHQWRENTTNVLDALKKQAPMSIISGDSHRDELRLRSMLSSDVELFFNQLPEDKLHKTQYYQSQGHVVTVFGDGLNDAGALMQSDTGLCITDEVNNFSPACDAILEGKSFGKLPSFLKLTHATKWIIYLSFFISLAYNTIGISFAVQGKLQPVIAAILMPLSTLTIILFTTGASRWTAKRLNLS